MKVDGFFFVIDLLDELINSWHHQLLTLIINHYYRVHIMLDKISYLSQVTHILIKSTIAHHSTIILFTTLQRRNIILKKNLYGQQFITILIWIFG